MTDANLRVDVDRVTRCRERLTERNILRVHIDQRTNSLKWSSEPGILQVLNDPFLDQHPAHTGIGHWYVLRCPDDVIWLKKLESSLLFKIFVVPILDGRKMLQILHHVQTGRDVMRAFQKGEKVLGLEDDVRVDPHHGIVVHLTLKRLLVRAFHDVSTQTLGAREMDDRRVLLTDHHLVATVRRLHQKIGPRQEKLTRVRATGHTEDDLH